MSMFNGKVFIASPSDVDAPRAAAERAINRYGLSSGVDFRILDYRRQTPTVQRPQQAINRMVVESDILVAIFEREWGSGTGDERFSSGTEEEIFVALADLASADGQLRDVWIFFMINPDRSPSLSLFRTSVIESKSIYFAEPADEAELERILGECLSGMDLSAPRNPQKSNLVTSMQVDYVGDSLRRSHVSAMIAINALDKAEESLLACMKLNDPEDLILLARIRRQMGKYSMAVHAARKARDLLVQEPRLWNRDRFADAIIELSQALRYEGSKGVALEELLSIKNLLTAASDDRARSALAAVCDQIGLIKSAARDYVAAEESFRAGLRYREAAGVSVDQIGQSHVNLGRLALKTGDLAGARSLAERAMSEASDGDGHLQANCHALMAQVHLAEGDPERALASAQESLGLNIQNGLAGAAASSRWLAARCLQSLKRWGELDAMLVAAISDNEKIGDANNRSRCQRWLEDLRSGKIG